MRQPRIVPPLLFCLIVSVATLRGQTKPPMPPVAAAPTTVPAKSTVATANTKTAAVSTPVAAVPPAYPKTPAEFFARARQLSDLEAAGIPFHLKATFVASGGKDSGTGTYEEWWKDADNWRKEAKFGDFRIVSMNTPAGPRLYASPEDVPQIVLAAMGKVLVQIEPDGDIQRYSKVKQENVGGMMLTMIPVKPHKTPSGEFVVGHTDYFTSGGVIRIRQSINESTVYNSVEPFQGLLVPRIIEVRSERKRLLRISIDTLGPLATDNKTTALLSTAPTDLSLVGNVVVSGTGGTAGRLIRKVQPNYPEIARAERIQGTVVLSAIIDDQGEIRDLRSMKSPNMLLTSAALQAVRQWRYKPATLNGKPVGVYTTISVVFTMNY